MRSLGTQCPKGRKEILRDQSLTTSHQTRKVEKDGGKKVPYHEDPCNLRLPALSCGYCYAPKTRTPRTSPQVARRAGKKGSTAQTSALDARHGMAKRSMPPHTPCTWAMTCFSTWTGPLNKRAPSAGPRREMQQARKRWKTVISSSLVPDRPLTRRLPKLQGSDLTIMHTALHWAALVSSYPLATLCTLSTRRLGTQVF
jgi:hypothetical protein